MGGVYRSDMLKSLYERHKKAKKWCHRLFDVLMEIKLVNLYENYREQKIIL